MKKRREKTIRKENQEERTKWKMKKMPEIISLYEYIHWQMKYFWDENINLLATWWKIWATVFYSDSIYLMNILLESNQFIINQQ